MPQIARVGDLGFGSDCCCGSSCSSMTGIIITGSPNVTNGPAIARTTDLVLSNCGNIGIIVSGSSSVFNEGLQLARIGDSFSGCFTGTIISGSANTICG